MTVIPVAEGVYRVETDAGAELVYVVGPAGDQWAFWNGHVYRGALAGARQTARRSRRAHGATPSQLLTAPMPATVVKVLAQPGTSVRKGDAVVLLEAMKMELPLRASGDALVRAVHCREGELVQPDTVLIELE
jgi:3-methylcrotonyl-CoA carboxylase alpha subunit